MTENNSEDKAHRAVYKTDFTQEDWKRWVEELENQSPPSPPKLMFYSVEAMNKHHEMIHEYFEQIKIKRLRKAIDVTNRKIYYLIGLFIGIVVGLIFICLL